MSHWNWTSITRGYEYFQGYDDTTNKTSYQSCSYFSSSNSGPSSSFPLPHDPPQYVALSNWDNNRKWESRFKLDIHEFYENPKWVVPTKNKQPSKAKTKCFHCQQGQLIANCPKRTQVLTTAHDPDLNILL